MKLTQRGVGPGRFVRGGRFRTRRAHIVYRGRELQDAAADLVRRFRTPAAATVVRVPIRVSVTTAVIHGLWSAHPIQR